jgi:hypothetical protein
LPEKPVIATTMKPNFDSLVVDEPPTLNSVA